MCFPESRRQPFATPVLDHVAAFDVLLDVDPDIADAVRIGGAVIVGVAVNKSAWDGHCCGIDQTGFFSRCRFPEQVVIVGASRVRARDEE